MFTLKYKTNKKNYIFMSFNHNIFLLWMTFDHCFEFLITMAMGLNFHHETREWDKKYHCDTMMLKNTLSYFRMT